MMILLSLPNLTQEKNSSDSLCRGLQASRYEYLIRLK